MKPIVSTYRYGIECSSNHKKGDSYEYPDIDVENINEGCKVERWCSVPQRLPQCEGDPGEDWYCVVYHRVPIKIECQGG